MIVEKCVFCGNQYNSLIDKKWDICPTCEIIESEEYDKQDFKDMIMTYSDETLEVSK